MRLLTIGSNGKSAKMFFGALKQADVQKLIDVRRKNTSPFARFTKAPDLKFFLEECFGIAFEHLPEFGPSEDLLEEYQTRLGKKKRDDAAWAFYVKRFRREVLAGPIVEKFKHSADGFETVCLLCAEETADRCHRRLLAEHFRDRLSGLEVIHL